MTMSIRDWPGRSPVPLLSNLNSQQNAVTQSECQGTTIELLFQSIPTNVTTLFFFYGNNCELDMPTRNTDQSACISLMRTVPTGNNNTLMEMVALSDLLDCSSTETTRNFYVMAMNTETDTVTAGQYVEFTMQFDFNAPAAPSEVMAGNGESDVTLTWAGSSEELDPYEIYVDPDGCPDGMNPSGALVDNDPPPSSLRVTGSSPPGNTSSVDVPVPASVATNASFAIGIRAVDLAGNASPTTVVCATKIDVTSFWDAYCSANPDDCGSCAVRPGRSGPPAAWLLGVAGALALTWLRRRSR